MTELLRYVLGIKPFNRRRHPRREPYGMILCACRCVQDHQTVEFACEIANVSLGGVLLMTNKIKLYPHTAVEILFHLPGDAGLRSVRGAIVRTYRRQGQSWYYSGVKFSNPQERAVAELLQYAERIR